MGTIYSLPSRLSSPVLFKGKFFRSSVNIHHCFPLQRQRIVQSMHRPWASGLARLLADRRLKKGDLAELAGVRPGTISAVANSPKSPDIATLQRLADGLTKHDRHANPTAPAVQLWEFFVSDEQAALLRQSASNNQVILEQGRMIDRVMDRLAPLVTSVIQHELSGQPVPAQPTQKKKSA
jgi:transcriptional regulator with XRE-family HTH domain